MSALSVPYMHDEAAAFAHIEAMLWPHGAVCPRCGVVGNAYELKGVRSKSSKKHPKGKERRGLKKCKDCGKQFTVRIGTIFENSHVDLHLWLQAMYLMTSSKKGISSHQLHRTLGITVKSAWFMSHRIREAMRSGSFKAPLGGEGKKVEADETFIGRKKGVPVNRGTAHKMAVLSLVERGGEVRSFPHQHHQGQGDRHHRQQAHRQGKRSDDRRGEPVSEHRQALRVSRLGYAQRWPVTLTGQCIATLWKAIFRFSNAA